MTAERSRCRSKGLAALLCASLTAACGSREVASAELTPASPTLDLAVRILRFGEAGVPRSLGPESLVRTRDSGFKHARVGDHAGHGLAGILRLEGGPALAELVELGILGLQQRMEAGVGTDLRAGDVLAEALGEVELPGPARDLLARALRFFNDATLNRLNTCLTSASPPADGCVAFQACYRQLQPTPPTSSCADGGS